jgi:hypothetical protein
VAGWLAGWLVVVTPDCSKIRQNGWLFKFREEKKIACARASLVDRIDAGGRRREGKEFGTTQVFKTASLCVLSSFGAPAMFIVYT